MMQSHQAMAQVHAQAQAQVQVPQVQVPQVPDINEAWLKSRDNGKPAKNKSETETNTETQNTLHRESESQTVDMPSLATPINRDLCFHEPVGESVILCSYTDRSRIDVSNL